MGFLNSVFGQYVKQTSKLTDKKTKEVAYNDSVLAQMADLNNEQLDEGLYSDGKDTPDYSPYTIEIKKMLGQEYRFMTFKDTGQTRESIRYVLRGGKLIATINDRYDLLTNYSENIIGLTAKSIEDVKDEIIENIQEEILPKSR